MSETRAIQAINNHGVLLVFPIHNSKEPASLWSAFFPRSKMKWEWDDDGDNRVARMWMLMKQLSSSRAVIYSKWYKGRATFFSRPVFAALFRLFRTSDDQLKGLSRTAQILLEVLEADSPLSTKQLKKMTDLQGRFNEPEYSRAMKDLFSHLLIVAFGEVDDGAFPSLAVGATRNLFEDVCSEAEKLSLPDAQDIIARAFPTGSALEKFLRRFLPDYSKR